MKFDKGFDMKPEEAATFMSDDKLVHIDMVKKDVFKVSINEKNDLQCLKEVVKVTASCDKELSQYPALSDEACE